MVAAHLHAMPAGILKVPAIAVLLVGSTLGGLDVDILDVWVASSSFPVDIFLIIRHINAIVDERGTVAVVLVAHQLHLMVVVTGEA